MENNASHAARILVMYHSEGGNTKIMAGLVAEGASGVPDTEIRLKPVAETTADDLTWCDGVAAGSPTHMGTIAWEMKRCWDVVAQPLWPQVEGKIGCAFSSTGGGRRRIDVSGAANRFDELRPFGFWSSRLRRAGPDIALRRDLRRPSAQRRRTRSLPSLRTAFIRVGADVHLQSSRTRSAPGDLSQIHRLKKSRKRTAGAVRFKLTASCTRSRRATSLRHAKNYQVDCPTLTNPDRLNLNCGF